MDQYSLLRHFADSWALIALVLVFLGAIGWAFRPGSRKIHDDIADIPFRNEDKPARGPRVEGPAQEARK